MGRGEGFSVYRRGNILWFQTKDLSGKSVCRSTGLRIGQEEQALQFVRALKKRVDEIRGDIKPDASIPRFEPPRRTIRRLDPVERQNKSPGKMATIYAVQLLPEELPERVKFGYTARSVADRLKHYRTVCPSARLLAVWSGDRSHEQVVLNTLPGRLGTSEVFNCASIPYALGIIDDLLGDRLLYRT
ncbi:MAG TPA: hypothetical protein VNT29_10505 [Candidatus Limnocylindrales bacterium]|nr:hypothetical protein [Candidatus Limnocylindrales bacterium]